jgi:maleamate amidohydrolase
MTTVNPDLLSQVEQQLDASRQALRAKGFGGSMGFGRRAALLVVDLVNGFTDPTSPLGFEQAAVVQATNQLIQAARSSGSLVVFSTVTYDDFATEGGQWGRKITGNSALTSGADSVAVDERLSQDVGDIILEKKYASCFFETALHEVLRHRGIDTLVLAGCTTSGCVRATAVDACSAGLSTIVVRDAVGDRAPLSHLVSLFDIEMKYGDVVGLADAMAGLSRAGVQ